MTRDTDSNGSTNYTLTHDAVGQLTDDGKDYKYKYDGFGRLKEVRNQSNNLVAEYRYNGLGYRIGWHYDANASGAVDGSDPWYYFVYDERWRPVATYRGSDTNPKELFVFNAAGKGGMGGSSYIDSVVLRDKDGNTAWTSAADGTLEDRIYYCQNWRNDVSVLVKPDSGNGLEIVEWIKYSAYGVPYCIAAADYNRSGATDTADSTAFDTDFNNSNTRADVNFDGTVDLADFFTFYNAHASAGSGGRNVASQAGVGSRIGYAGYQWDTTTRTYHVRHRVLYAQLGRWLSRDPIEYSTGMSLMEYGDSRAINGTDPSGLCCQPIETPATPGMFIPSILNPVPATPFTPSDLIPIPGFPFIPTKGPIGTPTTFWDELQDEWWNLLEGNPGVGVEGSVNWCVGDGLKGVCQKITVIGSSGRCKCVGLYGSCVTTWMSIQIKVAITGGLGVRPTLGPEFSGGLSFTIPSTPKQCPSGGLTVLGQLCVGCEIGGFGCQACADVSNPDQLPSFSFSCAAKLNLPTSGLVACTGEVTLLDATIVRRNNDCRCVNEQ